MRIVRFSVGGKVKFGVLKGNVIQGLRRSPFVGFRHDSSPFPLDGSSYKLGEVRLLAPCLPAKIVGIGLNYRGHAAERGHQLPSIPRIFLKPATAVIGPDDKIVLPRGWKEIHYEGELGVVIGRKARYVPEDRAGEYILGYTCCNDVSDRVAQKEDSAPTRGKIYDTFAPIGPCIETEVEPGDLKLETRLNGELRQSASTSDLIFGIPALVSFTSAILTLLPGDIISTGTPEGVGQIKPGDVVEIKIEKIGTLRNYVVGPE